MERTVEKREMYPGEVSDSVRTAALGSTAMAPEMAAGIQQEMITDQQIKEVAKTRYAEDLATKIYEHGDIVDEFNTMKAILKLMDMEYAERGRKNHIRSAVHTLSDCSMVRTRKTILKTEAGKEVITFARLERPGNFVVLNRDNFERYQKSKES